MARRRRSMPSRGRDDYLTPDSAAAARPTPSCSSEFTRRYQVIGGLTADRDHPGPGRGPRRRDWAGRPRPGCASRIRRSPTAIRDLAGPGRRRDRGDHPVAAVLATAHGRLRSRQSMPPGRRSATARRGSRSPGAWHLQPAFIECPGGSAPSRRSAGCRPRSGTTVAILMTAHSLPRRVAEQEPGYLGPAPRYRRRDRRPRPACPQSRWTFCWQSAGHEPGEWMKPDFADLMPGIAAAGGRSVIVVPVQFLADHLEILYDVDIGAREQAERCRPDLCPDRVAQRGFGPGRRPGRCRPRDAGRLAPRPGRRPVRCLGFPRSPFPRLGADKFALWQSLWRSTPQFGPSHALIEARPSVIRAQDELAGRSTPGGPAPNRHKRCHSANLSKRQPEPLGPPIRTC